MKKILFGAVLLGSLVVSCSKNDDGEDVPAVSYLSLTPGQTRTFEVKDSITGETGTVTQTSSSRDTAVAGRTYHVFDNSDGSREYFAVSGNNYFTLYNLPSGISDQPVELLYLKANGNVGTSWTQDFSFAVPGFPISIPVKFTHTIKEKGLSKTFGAITHTDVIRVESKITSTLLDIDSDIQTYCAPKYGVINITSHVAESTAGIEVNTRRTMISANF